LATEPYPGEVEAFAVVALDHLASFAVASGGHPSYQAAIAAFADLDASSADLDLLGIDLGFVLEVCCYIVLVLLVFGSQYHSFVVEFAHCTG
jgi:hypothetical protein